MVIANEKNVRCSDPGIELFEIQDRIVSPEGLSEFPQIFASVGRVTRSDFTPHRR
jgi:hypothetical protein